jgi:putative zinc finger protein
VTTRGRTTKTEAIRTMIDHRLKSMSESEAAALPSESHLDEDTISAFVEGRLDAAESKPVVTHLTACGSCRRVSAQLVRLENQIDAEEAVDEEPGRLQAFLSNLSSVVSPGGEDVVFAYQNPSSDSEVANPKDDSINDSDEDEA